MQFSQQPKGEKKMKKDKAKEKSKTTPIRPEDHLPQRRPKKTGRAMPIPEDREEPAEKEPAEKGDEKEVDEAPVQGELLGAPQKAPSPAIMFGKMAMHFVGYKAKKNKEREKIVHVDLSVELDEKAHKGRFPQEIETAWKGLLRDNLNYVSPGGFGAQIIKLYGVPDYEEPDCDVIALITQCEISRIVEKGKGESREVIRLTLRLETDLHKDMDAFCVNYFDETIYAETIKPKQRKFGDKD
jgi:hypothetical protein